MELNMTEELSQSQKQDLVRKEVTTLMVTIGEVITTDIDKYFTDSI